MRWSLFKQRALRKDLTKVEYIVFLPNDKYYKKRIAINRLITSMLLVFYIILMAAIIISIIAIGFYIWSILFVSLFIVQIVRISLQWDMVFKYTFLPFKSVSYSCFGINSNKYSISLKRKHKLVIDSRGSLTITDTHRHSDLPVREEIEDTEGFIKFFSLSQQDQYILRKYFKEGKAGIKNLL